MKHPLVARCNDGRASRTELQELDDNLREIKYRTFAKHVDVGTLSELLGYSFGRTNRGLRLRDDYHVRYGKSKFRGRTCYHLDWSAVDHIFQGAAA